MDSSISLQIFNILCLISIVNYITSCNSYFLSSILSLQRSAVSVQSPKSGSSVEIVLSNKINFLKKALPERSGHLQCTASVFEKENALATVPRTLCTRSCKLLSTISAEEPVIRGLDMRPALDPTNILLDSINIKKLKVCG